MNARNSSHPIPITHHQPPSMWSPSPHICANTIATARSSWSAPMDDEAAARHVPGPKVPREIHLGDTELSTAW
jgi:hypothetical protein